MNSNTILINAISQERRVAYLESGTLAEYYSERQDEHTVVGNIYKGKVVRVLPGMQAAFVDIGLDKAAFLYAADAMKQTSVRDEEDGGRESNDLPLDMPSIGELVKPGQELIVQIKKAPVGTKGARITTHITLPGRFLVLMPETTHVGVSRRIADDAERQRLRTLLEEVKGEDQVGLIARTVAEGVSREKLSAEIKMLKTMWESISQKAFYAPAPSCIHEDLDLVLRAVRDILDDNVNQVIVDNPIECERIEHFVEMIAPAKLKAVKYYSEIMPLFDRYGVENEIERAMDHKVWLKSGGYIVIDPTEALTVIDVNSGKFVGHSSLEQTITQINVEAAKEIALQLRLRNIGGIVIIDFIDMEEEYNKERVLVVLEEALKRDRSRSYVVGMTELGLVQLTRKRYQEPLGTAATEPCPHCLGTGRVKTITTIVHEVFRSVQRYLLSADCSAILVNVNPAVADYLYEQEEEAVGILEEMTGTEIIFVAREGYHEERFDIVGTPKRSED